MYGGFSFVPSCPIPRLSGSQNIRGALSTVLLLYVYQIKLLAPQSGALRRLAFRDFQSHPSTPSTYRLTDICKLENNYTLCVKSSTDRLPLNWCLYWQGEVPECHLHLGHHRRRLPGRLVPRPQTAAGLHQRAALHRCLQPEDRWWAAKLHAGWRWSKAVAGQSQINLNYLFSKFELPCQLGASW